MKQFLILMSIAGVLSACNDTDGSEAQGQQGLKQEEAAAVTPKIENLGGECETDADCKGTGTRCIIESSISGLTYPGGFCTASCAADADCGEGGACPLADIDASMFPSPEIKAAVTVCLQKCEADEDCREGYACSKESSLSFISAEENTQGYCQPKPAEGEAEPAEGEATPAEGEATPAEAAE